MKSARPKTPYGFTLIELLVAIAIVAVISTIGFAMFSQAQKTARDGRRTADLEEIQKALEQYYAVNQAYPAEASYATALNSYFASGTVPRDPTNSGSYVYTYRDCSSSTSKYNVCALLESCGSKCNFVTLPTANNGCGAAPTPPVASATLLCRSNISN